VHNKCIKKLGNAEQIYTNANTNLAEEHLTLPERAAGSHNNQSTKIEK
jgi:hypothetical protein